MNCAVMVSSTKIVSCGKASPRVAISVTGSIAKITAAFHTSLSNYVDPRGIRYFQNSRTLQVPTSIVSDIQGVVGLTNTVREQIVRHQLIDPARLVLAPLGFAAEFRPDPPPDAMAESILQSIAGQRVDCLRSRIRI